MCYRGNTERGVHNQHQPRHGNKQHGLVLPDSTVLWQAARPSTSPIMWTPAVSRVLNSTLRGLDPVHLPLRVLLLNCRQLKLKRIVPVKMSLILILMASSTCHQGHERELLMNMEMQDTKVLL